jgi:6-phosphogluconolactonase
VFISTVKFNQCVATVGCLVFAVFFQICGMSAEANSKLLYIGTYTGAKSKGIYSARFDSESGKLSAPELAAETKNPTFLALHPNGSVLYAVGEVDDFQGKRTGAVSAFSIDLKAGKLSLLNQQPSAGGGPCHLVVDKSGKCVLVANYGSGSVAALPIESDGKLSEPRAKIQHTGSSVNRERQAGPHAHYIATDPENRYALACDLGLDKVLIYKLEPDKAFLTPNVPPSASVTPGSGPRHMAFHPNGRWAYLVSEMEPTITVFSYPSDGVLSELQTISTLADKYSGFKSGAEVQVHPSGKFVYGSNRGHDSIAVFSVDETSGKLTFVEHQSTRGKTPRHFAIDPTGKWLLAENQDSDSIVIFRIDQGSGKLSPTGDKVEVGAPVCIQFVPESVR